MTIVKQWSGAEFRAECRVSIPQQEAINMLFDVIRKSMWDQIM
jgi:hypothetical protein